MKADKNRVILYRDEEGNAEMSVLFSDDDVWMTQAQLVELYGTMIPNISMHISNIYDERELSQGSTVKNFLIVQEECKIANVRIVESKSNRLKYSLSFHNFRKWVVRATVKFFFTVQKSSKAVGSLFEHTDPEYFPFWKILL